MTAVLYIHSHAFITNLPSVADWSSLVRLWLFVCPIRRQAMERPVPDRARVGAGGELEMVGRAARQAAVGDAAAGSPAAEVA